MNTQHNTASPADIDAQKRAHTHAQIEHARAVIDAHEPDRAAAAADSARPIVDANRTARELVYLLEENRPVDAAAKLAGLPASQALSVALALDCPRHQRAALRLAYDANERETLESEHLHADACGVACSRIADAIADPSNSGADVVDIAADALAAIGYTVDSPEEFYAEPPTE